jgi:CDP-glucose 4,6-dehydratase
MEEMVVSTLFDELRASYKGKKVFLTGHTGFKGSWMLKVLNMLGAEVRGYALDPKSENDLFHIINGARICDSIISDLRDKKALSKAIFDFQPDFVFHLAAQPLVRLSYEMPAETFEVNAIGSANVLDAVASLSKQCQVVMITTDKVYFNNEWEYPYRENDRLGGYDPYSASKACAELVIDSYRNSFFNLQKYDDHKKAISVARAGNVIGGGDWSQDRLIPDIVRALISDNPVMIRNPKAVRPWQHVLEPVVGYLILGQKLSIEPLKYSEAYNFGPNSTDTFPVLNMVEQSIKVFGKGSYKIDISLNQPHEAGLLKLDISKVKIQLDWHPKMSAQDAITLTIDWYKSFIDMNNMDEVTESQIVSFLS